jgi:hypothetical protein
MRVCRLPPLKWLAPRGRIAIALIATALLAGCASTLRMDNTVQSFSALSEVPTAAGYRYERLPSQRQDPAQPPLEALTDVALARVGLRRDDAAPVYTVQVWSRMQYAVSPWAQPRFGGWSGWGGVGLGSYRGMGMGMGIGFPIGGIDSPWYQREVGLILREVASGRVVYETHAFHEGYWIDPARAWPAMLEAALQGFPQPPAGVRRVDITLTR